MEKRSLTVEKLGKIPFEHRNFSEDLSKHCTFRIGGYADCALFPVCAEEMAEDIRLCRKNGISYVIIGNGSNVLFSDEGYEGAVIFTSGMKEMTVFKKGIRCDAGVPLSRLAVSAQRNALGNIAFLHGIPGTVGGAVVMNAGAFGGEIGSFVDSVQIYDEEQDTIRVLSREECAFGYRDSIFQHCPYTVLRVSLGLSETDGSAVKEEMKQLLERRKSSQPLEFPSAGSVFKRREDKPVAKMIDDAGLKGVRIGGAEISEKHAGFIINRENATAKDILALIALIQDTLKEKEGIVPECEIRII